MKVMILCGGMGTRLREHTETRPKPMVEIGGRPILWHIMKLYAHHGLTDFILCLGYKGSVIKQYFLNYHAINQDFTIRLGSDQPIGYHTSAEDDAEDWTVTLADTGETSLTGTRARIASRHLDDDPTFALTYGDGVAALDLRQVLAFHRSHGRLATVTGVRPPSRFGEMAVDGARVTRFSEKPQLGQGMINGGFFFFQREFMRYLEGDRDLALEGEPLERCARDQQLMVYEHAGYWQCMDTYRDCLSLDRQWRDGTAAWRVWR